MTEMTIISFNTLIVYEMLAWSDSTSIVGILTSVCSFGTLAMKELLTYSIFGDILVVLIGHGVDLVDVSTISIDGIIDGIDVLDIVDHPYVV